MHVSKNMRGNIGMLDNVFWRVIFVFGLKKGNVKNVLTVCVLNSILCYELVNVFVRIKKKKSGKETYPIC